jgi:hypothetical protein
MNSPPPKGSDWSDSGNQAPARLPPCLPALRDYEKRISDLFAEIRYAPDKLDVKAGEVHEKIVVSAYRFMNTEVAQACGARWAKLEQLRFRNIYNEVADNWSAYQVGLAELELIRNQGGSRVDAMRRLKAPRRDYINALEVFYEVFSGTLNSFFPPP